MIIEKVAVWAFLILAILLAIVAVGLVIEGTVLENNLKTLKRQESEEIKQRVMNLRQTLSREFKERYKDFISSFEKRANELEAEKKRVKELENVVKGETIRDTSQ